jgi:hypothetical protein
MGIVPEKTIPIRAQNGIIHDPNNLVDFATGAHRSSAAGKGRYDLIPTEAKRRVAIKYEQGGINHGDRNWEKGMPFSRLVDSAQRHLDQYLSGDRSEDHLAAIVWNVNAIMHFEKYMPEMNDLPDYNRKLPELTPSPLQAFKQACDEVEWPAKVD